MTHTIDDILFTLPDQTVPISWYDLFGNDRPVELEIGAGSGGFLLRQAIANPMINYVGVEWAGSYCHYCADRVARHRLSNVRMIRTNGRHLMIERIVPCSLSALHIYHPDPWPKRRHHRRRLIQPDFVEAAIRSLRIGGVWSLQTDHPGYFEVIQGLLSSQVALEQTLFLQHNEGATDQLIQTNFQTKYVQQGRSIYRLQYVRKSN